MTGPRKRIGTQDHRAIFGTPPPAMSDRPLTPPELANRARENAKNLRSGARRFGVIHTIVIEPEPFARLYEELADEVDRLTDELDSKEHARKAWEDSASARGMLWRNAERERDAERAGREKAEQERNQAWSVRDRLDKQFSEQLAKERAGWEQERDSLRLKLQADRNGLLRDIDYLIRQRDDARAQVASLLGRGNQG